MKSNRKNKQKRIASRRRVLGLEQLEKREVLAGNVSAVIRGGDLFVNGDSQGNDITIIRSGSNGVTISGNGTTVNGQAAVTLNNFRRSMIVTLNGGNDSVLFKSTADNLFDIAGNLHVETAGGNDKVDFVDARVRGLLFVNTGSGNDEVNGSEGFTGWSLRADGVATILAGTGNDVVSLSRARFAKHAAILMEKDTDNLFLSNSFFLKTSVLSGGLGQDRLDTANTAFSKRPVVVLFETRGSNPPPVNAAPVAVNDTATLAEGGTTSINVAANDTDSDGTINLGSIVVTQNPANGSVTVNSNGTVSYTHNGSETTTDSFRYTIKDDDGAVSGTATVSITITPANDAPVAVNDTATVAEAGTVSIPVSTNDTDADGTIDVTSIVVTQNPANGSVTVNSNGSVSYTHDGSNTTTDSFRYTIKDNTGAVSGTATVTITVTGVNDPPVAVNDVATVAEGATASINVASNDTDSDGTIDLTSIVVTQNPANGSVTVNTDGTVSYTHNGSETTSDSFLYTIEDNTGAVSGTATVTITITPVNDAPVAVNDAATVDEGASASIPVSTNDTDADGTIDVTTVVIVQNPAHGTAVANADGTVTYTNDGSENATDSFTYTIKDNNGLVSGTATVSITVTPVNDAPVAVNDTATVAEGAAANLPVSTNDTDADGTIDPASIVIIQAPVNGTAVPNANGTVTYTHDGSSTTSDSFTYTIKDNLGAVSGTATVAITVTTTNDPPVAVNDVLTVAEGAAGSVNVATNDTDSDGTIDVTSIVIIQAPANGSAVANGDGTVTYTHDGSETTTDSFTYTIKDNAGSISGTATVTITVTPVNDAPVAVNDALTVAEGAAGSVNVATNDTDADGTIDLATVVIIQNGANGAAVANPDGTVTYTHNGSETTTDSFTYTIQDNNGLVSGTATVTVTVTPVNDAPVAVDDALTVNEDASGSVNVATNDTDADGTIDVATVVIIQNGANGTAVANPDGTVTYTHDGSETTTDTFTYTIQDNNGLVSGTATVTVTVTPVNDAPVAVDDALTVNEGAAGSVNVATNDTDADGTIDVATVVIIQNGANGAAVANPDGTVTYTHDGSETTSDTFTYTIKDNNGLVSGTATVTVTVTPVNDAPVAVDDALTVNEGASASIPVSTNDTDADGTIDVTTVVIVQNPAHGTAVANADGTVTYTHDGSDTTTDSFTYTIKDNNGLVSGTGTVSITVTPVNDAPVAMNDTATVAEGAAANLPVATNDTDVDGTIDLTSIVIIQAPANGTAVPNANGTVTYTHDGSSTTSDSFTYTIKDNLGAVSGTATVAITVTTTNDPPVAVNDVLTVAEGAAGSVNVATNDTDSDGTIDVTSIVIIQAPANGSAVANGDGTVTYTHDGSETTTDSFTYTIKDNAGSISGTATVTITVTPVNDAPVAVNDALTVAEGAAGSVNVATNDTDADGTIDLATVVIIQNGANGTAVANPDGTVTYTHDGSETTTDSFTYTIQDNNGLVSGTATVTVTVTPVSDAPVAVNDEFTVDEDGSLTISAPGVLANDTDAEGNPLTASLVTGPLHGSLSLASDGSFTYTPDPNFNGTDGFSYTANDGTDDSAVAAVTINVTPVNDAPVAVDDALTVDEGAAGSVTVAINDTDADGTIDVATVVIIQNGANGTAVANPDGTVTYTHDRSETTTDTFTYTIQDNNGLVSGTATVTVTVTPVNDAPVAVDDALTVNEGAAGSVNVATNDTDADGTIDVATVVIIQNGANGTAVANPDGTVTYTHDGSETTTDTFTYTIQDNNGLVSGTATVTVTVTPVNDAPVAVDDALTVNEGAAGSVNVATNDTDADGTIDVATVVIIQNGANGTAVANPDGTVTYTHDGSETTTDTFTYTIQDNNGLVSGTATVTVTVTPVNDAPVANPDAGSVANGNSVTINVASNDTDDDNALDLTSIVITQLPANGTATPNPDGTVTYTHDGSATTSDSFEYTIKDVSGAISSAITVSITIT